MPHVIEEDILVRLDDAHVRVVQMLGDPVGRDEHLRVCVSTLGEARIGSGHDCLLSTVMRLTTAAHWTSSARASGDDILRFYINNYKNTPRPGCQPRAAAAQLAMFRQSVW